MTILQGCSVGARNDDHAAYKMTLNKINALNVQCPHRKYERMSSLSVVSKLFASYHITLHSFPLHHSVTAGPLSSITSPQQWFVKRERVSALACAIPFLCRTTTLYHCSAYAQRVSFAPCGADLVRYASGLWSDTTNIFAPNIHVSNFLRPQITPNASRSIVDHLI